MRVRLLMIWIKDIWIYFLNEPDIERAYFDYNTDAVGFNPTASSISIPRIFSRVELLREYIQICGDSKLIRIAHKLSDEQLCRIYHNNYSPYYDINNIYSQWIPFAKNKIFIYAEDWCFSNNIKCTKKEKNIYDKFTYLDCL